MKPIFPGLIAVPFLLALFSPSGAAAVWPDANDGVADFKRVCSLIDATVRPDASGTVRANILVALQQRILGNKRKLGKSAAGQVYAAYERMWKRYGPAAEPVPAGRESSLRDGHQRVREKLGQVDEVDALTRELEALEKGSDARETVRRLNAAFAKPERRSAGSDRKTRTKRQALYAKVGEWIASWRPTAKVDTILADLESIRELSGRLTVPAGSLDDELMSYVAKEVEALRRDGADRIAAFDRSNRIFDRIRASKLIDEADRLDEQLQQDLASAARRVDKDLLNARFRSAFRSVRKDVLGVRSAVLRAIRVQDRTTKQWRELEISSSSPSESARVYLPPVDAVTLVYRLSLDGEAPAVDVWQDCGAVRTPRLVQPRLPREMVPGGIVTVGADNEVFWVSATCWSKARIIRLVQATKKKSAREHFRTLWIASGGSAGESFDQLAESAARDLPAEHPLNTPLLLPAQLDDKTKLAFRALFAMRGSDLLSGGAHRGEVLPNRILAMRLLNQGRFPSTVKSLASWPWRGISGRAAPCVGICTVIAMEVN